MKFIKISGETQYALLQNEAGEDAGGVIVSFSRDLDRAADQVAEDIGRPIDYGSWRKAADLSMFKGPLPAGQAMTLTFNFQSDLED